MKEKDESKQQSAVDSRDKTVNGGETADDKVLLHFAWLLLYYNVPPLSLPFP